MPRSGKQVRIASFEFSVDGRFIKLLNTRGPGLIALVNIMMLATAAYAIHESPKNSILEQPFLYVFLIVGVFCIGVLKDVLRAFR